MVHTLNNFSMCNMAPTHSLRGFWFVPEELREEVEGEGVSLGLQNLAEQLQTPAGMAAETARPGGWGKWSMFGNHVVSELTC